MTLCTICYELIEKEKRELSCKHIFHNYCIETYYKKHSNCPLCRSDDDLGFFEWNDLLWDSLCKKKDDEYLINLIEYGINNGYPFNYLGLSDGDRYVYHPVLRAQQTGYSLDILKRLYEVIGDECDICGRKPDKSLFGDCKKINYHQIIKTYGLPEIDNLIKNNDPDIEKKIPFMNLKIIPINENYHPLVTAIKNKNLEIIRSILLNFPKIKIMSLEREITPIELCHEINDGDKKVEELIKILTM